MVTCSSHAHGHDVEPLSRVTCGPSFKCEGPNHVLELAPVIEQKMK